MAESRFDMTRAIGELYVRRPDLARLADWRVAVMVGISPSYWTMLRSGARRGNLDVIIGMSRAFGFPIADILEWGGLESDPKAQTELTQDGRLLGHSTTKHNAGAGPASGGGDEPPGSHYRSDIRLERDLRPLVITGLKIVPQFQGGGPNGSLPFVGDLLTMPRKSHNTKMGVSRERVARRRSKRDAWEGEGALAA